MMITNNSPTIFKSFSHAFNGLLVAIKTQRNVKIEILYLFLITILSCFLKVEIIEILKIILSVLIVIITELINTAIEFLTDLVVQWKWNKDAKIVKDISASAVLISVIYCIVTNAIILLPYIR